MSPKRVMGFLVLAYQPLSDEDLQAYQAWSESDAGVLVNRALFAAFAEVYTPISRSLGQAAAAHQPNSVSGGKREVS